MAQREPGQAASLADISASEAIPKKFLEKILQDLIHAGVATSRRGSHGGYALTRSPSEISFKQVMEAVEGPIALTQCSEGESQCAMEKRCDVRPHLSIINSTVRTALAQVSLADTARGAPVMQQAH